MSETLTTSTITVSNKALAPALTRALGAALKGSTIPILECALLTVDRGMMIIETTNMEMTIRQTLPIAEDARWKAAINVTMLSDISRRLPSEANLTLEHGSGQVVLKSGRTRIVFRTSPVEDFPIFREASYPCEFTMKAQALAALLERTMPFVSTDASRYYLSGVHLSLQVRDGVRMLRAAATNGNQLGVSYDVAPVQEMPEIIIPRPMLTETMKILDGEDGEIKVSISHNAIRIVRDGTLVVSKLVDGTFPEIDRVIPRVHNGTLRVDTKAFLRAISIVGVMAEQRGTQFVRLDITRDGMTLRASDPEAGEGVEELSQGDMEYDGDPLKIAFQPKFLTEAARLCGETAEFRFNNHEAPFRAGKPGDDNAIYVAMPARY